MADDIVETLKAELASHGASGFRIHIGAKHRRLYWTYDGKEMFHVVALNGSTINQRTMLAIRDVRRMIGVNQGSGPGERRERTIPRKNGHTIAPPPETITVKADPMAVLQPLRKELDMEQTAVETAPVKNARKSKAKPAFVMPTPTNREREWLEEMLARGERDRHIIQKRRVTPGLAAAMLELNLANRPIVELQVKMHQDRLIRGDFILTHQGISFAKTRVLNDGGHRLTAIARSGVTGDLQITFGAEREEFHATDIGRQRRPSDLVGVSVKDSPVLRAAIARLLIQAETGVRIPDTMIVAEKAIQMNAEEITGIAVHLAWAMKKVASTSPIGAAYYWIATRSPNKKRVNEFFDAMPSGQNLVGLKLRLREWLRNRNLQRVKAPGGENFWRMAGIILAWNAWLEDGQRARFDWKSSVTFPEVK